MRLALARALFVKVGLYAEPVIQWLIDFQAIIVATRRALQPQCAPFSITPNATP